MRPLLYLIYTVLLITPGACSAQPENPVSGDEKTVSADTVAAANTQFALDLYQQLRTTEGNLFYSPFSISTAMAMVYAGAEGRTEDQMVHALHFPADTKAFHAMYGDLIDHLNRLGQQGPNRFSAANALWAQQGYRFLDAYLQLNQTYYHAGLETVDFQNHTEQARRTINQWVEKKTNDKIKDLLPPGALDAMTRLVLTNAVYFKGTWAEQFDKQQTLQAPFYVAPDTSATAPLMFRKGDFKYVQLPDLQIAELPYEGGDLSMLILLPTARDGLAELEKQLTADHLTEWQKALQTRQIRLYLPKFTMSSRFSLARTLAAMGMPIAFTEQADFSGMTGKSELLLSDVIHKAYVDVNEEGTEAAAATGAVVGITSIQPQPPLVRADHPFIFIIKDTKTGSLLFIGRLMDPTKDN